MHDNTLHFKIA